MNLERNVGRNDKNIRIAVGALLIIVGLFFAKSVLLTLIGIVVLATGLLSFCALYTLLGMNTATSAEQQSANPDLSERASENFDDFKDEVVETAGEVKDKAEDVIADVKEEADELVDDAKAKFDEVKDDASEFVDDAKQKIADAKDSIDKK